MINSFLEKQNVIFSLQITISVLTSFESEDYFYSLKKNE